MPTGRSSASALLQKVNSQLRGERVPLKTKEEDELAGYLNSLTQKTQHVPSANFEDFGDISISSGKDGMQAITPRGRRSASPAPAPASSKFLKKKTPQGAAGPAASVTGPKAARVVDDDEDEDDRDYRGGQIVIAGKKKAEASPSRPEKSSALNKANALTNKIQGRRADGFPLRRHVSRDSDSESEIGRRPGSADTSIGRDGRKFLKGRKTLDEEVPERGTPSPQLVQRSSSADQKKKTHRRSSKARGEIVRTLGNVYLTSEEESLAEFIHGLSASESSARRPQNLVAKKQQKWRKKAASPGPRQTPSPVQRSRSPSPFKRSPSPFGKLSRSQSQDSDLLDSMASEMMEGPQRHRHDSASSDDPLNINLMDVASLIPVSPRNKKVKGKQSHHGKGQKQSGALASSSGSVFKASSDNLSKAGKNNKKEAKKKPLKKSDSKSSVFESLGIHMVDELLGADGGKDQAGEYDLSDQSEIVTEKSDDRLKSVKNYDSESEIITELGAGSRPAPVRHLSTERSISTQLERSGVARKTNRRAVSDEETETGGDYSDDSFESDSRTVTQSQSVSARSKGGRKKSRRRPASRSESYSHESPRRHKIVMEQREVQVTAGDPLAGVAHRWDARQVGVSVSGPYGLQYVDPAPIATHVVSADALEAMTAYSPSVLALHEMMKAQVELVRNFADIQRGIYHSCLDGIKEDFKYTTLEDTKEYIKQNRKPRMTFKEALELVEQEEGVRS
ncbi:uncharacterized protein C19orf44 homolog [Aplysia californica]|uniref:Uncharacterized protein C19orf44 homolog n=1 Tax=Aplysia californica TaxID=6500 RepID=A0ABM0JZF8_APLCA|nr:uncharacterized protein C19orf44 homolog [Aplysia californica]